MEMILGADRCAVPTFKLAVEYNDVPSLVNTVSRKTGALPERYSSVFQTQANVPRF